MRMTLRQLKRVIREALSEGEGWASPPQPAGAADAVGDIRTREQLASLADTDDDETEDCKLPDHLREPEVKPEDTWGPVPPTAPDPYAQLDPLTNDWGILPSSPFKR